MQEPQECKHVYWPKPVAVLRMCEDTFKYHIRFQRRCRKCGKVFETG
jgi:hypothetical protein